MKKNKLVSLSIAAITTAVLLSGVTYAWFVNKANVTPVDVATGKIAITGISLKSGITNMLPGDKILLNGSTPVKVTQAGTREAIVEVSFENQLSAKLGASMTAPVAFAGDYNTDKTFKAARLADVASLSMEIVPGASNFVKVGDKYYAQLPMAAGSSITLGNVYLNIDGELGGNKGPAPNTPDRAFEMQSIFTANYSATAVQQTKAAIVDVFGQPVADALIAAGITLN